MIPPSDFPDIKSIEAIKSNASLTNDGKVSDKVKALREAIANGTYQVNAQAIAKRMVESGVLDG